LRPLYRPGNCGENRLVVHAPAFLACAHIATSPLPAMKTLCSSCGASVRWSLGRPRRRLRAGLPID
ncbi:MAG: hypothetical protein WBL40_02970, partial [Terrimicrobiaceae bacterium]